jgi:hypothetical protein
MPFIPAAASCGVLRLKIKFDEFGNKEITMDVEFTDSETYSIIKLLHQNTCSFIDVTTENGRFYSISKIYYNEQVSFHAGKDCEISLQFHILRSIFQPNQADSAAYWVLPLSNFISSFMGDHPKLNRHPLRLFSIPEIPEEMTDDQKLMVRAKAKEKNRLIIFNFLNRLGFVGSVPIFL